LVLSKLFLTERCEVEIKNIKLIFDENWLFGILIFERFVFSNRDRILRTIVGRKL
jgi:hypothetical protein